uniref:Immunoglobulin domain-containing protein n=1 Tax=Cyprinus carpio TaxID=7962 RepID=A0A8C1XP35_CYPCA
MTIKLSIEMKSTLKIVLFLLIMCGVFCAETDEVKSVSVMEGDAVTLNPDLTQIKGIVLLLWRFGDKGSTVAQIDGNEILYEDDEIFIDRLQLDQSGSLTIKNTRTKHTGLYEAEISHNTGTSYIRFSVTVYESPPEDSYRAEMKSVPVTEGDPVALRVPQLYGDELIVWRFGDEGKLIAKHDIEAKSSSFYDETDERFRNRLELDPQTGSLIITNTKSTDSGLYIVKISSNKQTSYQKYFVTISVPGLSPAAVAGIVVVLLVIAAAAAAAGVLFYRRRTSELKHQKSKISECHNETSEISEKLKRMSEISEELKQMTGRSSPFPAPPRSMGWQKAPAPWRTVLTPPLPHGRQPPLHIVGGRQRVRPSPATHSSPPPRATTAPDCYALLDGTADSPQRQGTFGSASLIPPGFRHQCNNVPNFIFTGRKRREPADIQIKL